jgi:hypothetical protein
MHAEPKRLLFLNEFFVCFVFLTTVLLPNSVSGQEDDDDPFGISKLDPVVENAPAIAVAKKQSVGHRYVKRHLDVQRQLIRRTCKLSDEEIKSLDAIGADVIDEGLARPGKQNAGGWLRGLFQPAEGVRIRAEGVDLDVNAIKKTIEKVDKLLASALSEDNREIYKGEVAVSRLFRCEANALFIIALLDNRLVLTLEQEAQLKAPIAKWFETVDLSLMYYNQAQGPVPEIAERVLADVLTKEQREAYKQLQKYNFDRLTYELQMMQHDVNVDVMVLE